MELNHKWVPQFRPKLHLFSLQTKTNSVTAEDRIHFLAHVERSHRHHLPLNTRPVVIRALGMSARQVSSLHIVNKNSIYHQLDLTKSCL